jgi:hypothetical protein
VQGAELVYGESARSGDGNRTRMASLEDRTAIMIRSCIKLNCGYWASGDMSDCGWPVVTLGRGTWGARTAQIAAVSHVDGRRLRCRHVIRRG